MPCCLALQGEVAYTAVDAKPKSTLVLRRLDNIAAHPDVSVLVDHYEENWSALWWIRLDGRARVVEAQAEREMSIGLLTAKYPQYQSLAIPGPVIAIEVERWTGWP